SRAEHLASKSGSSFRDSSKSEKLMLCPAQILAKCIPRNSMSEDVAKPPPRPPLSSPFEIAHSFRSMTSRMNALMLSSSIYHLHFREQTRWGEMAFHVQRSGHVEAKGLGLVPRFPRNGLEVAHGAFHL